ncbi:MAG: phosphotransferase [Chloroflexi bacterium]|nr:phosphotransferase [Chloroflexota bacterium]
MNDLELRKIAEGREAEIFEWEDGTALRLMRSPDAIQAVESEAAALKAAHDAGVSVPAPHDSVTVNGRPGLVMDNIDGLDLLTLIGTKPWHIWSVGITTGRLQAEMHEVTAPEGLPSLKESQHRRIQSDRVPPEMVSYAHEVLADLPDRDRLCHGDFHPGNILKAGGEYFIIDWSGVARGDPAADYARSQLMLQLGEPPPGSPFLIRTLAGVGKGILLSAYRRGYRSHRAPDEELVRRWMVPVMANRLVDGIKEERSKLLKLLEARLRERN